MFSRLSFLLATVLLLTAPAAGAQTGTEDSTDITGTTEEAAPRPRRWCLSANMDAILTSALFERPGLEREPTYLRFTFGTNLETDINYEVSDYLAVYTGLGIRNIGFTEKRDDATIKRRVYSLSVPLGFRIGALGRFQYALIGGGLDFPFNYREKEWTSRKDKHKVSEWFSDRTPAVMPYVFAGMGFKRFVTVKLEFYPGNFFNTRYEATADAGGFRPWPYLGYKAQLLQLHLGFDIHYKRLGRPADL